MVCDRYKVTCRKLTLALGLAGALVVMTPDTAHVREGKSWVCRAEGIYVACTNTRSWIPCQDLRSEGVGVDQDKFSAVARAEQMCSDNMRLMVSEQNRSGLSSIKNRCSITTCELR